MEILIRKGFSLNNIDRQLKEVTDYANKNMANSNFLFLKETSGNTRWCHSQTKHGGQNQDSASFIPNKIKKVMKMDKKKSVHFKVISRNNAIFQNE